MPLPMTGRPAAGERLARAVWDQRENFLPQNATGQPQVHHPGVNLLTDFVTTGGMTASDETGRFSVGADGFQIERDQTDESPRFGLRVDPRASSASVTHGDVTVGGGWGKNPYAYLDTGSIRLSGGYGAPQGESSTAASRAGSEGKPGGWGRVDFSLGRRGVAPVKEDAIGVVDRAVAPWRDSHEEQSGPESPREFLNKAIEERRAKDPGNWWRP